MRRLLPVFLVLACCGYTISQTVPDWHQKVSSTLLERTANGQSVPFLILLTQQADVSASRQLDTKDEKATYVFQLLSAKAAETQSGLIEFLEHKNIPFSTLWIVNAIKTEGTIDLIQSLAQRNDVKYISANPEVKLETPVEWPGVSDGNRANITWGIDTINANDVWDLGYRGQGVTVGGGDTGYEWAHPALKKQYRGYDLALDTANHNFNWHDAIHEISPLSNDSVNPCGIDLQEPCDDFGHGTHTMGTMIGLDTDEAIGVAPEAKWCACRNMEQGNGSPFTYIECFQWFLAPTDLHNENPDPTKSPHVINNSWGCPKSEGCDSSNWELMNIAINNLRLAGTVVVVSAGNSGSGCSSITDAAAFFDESFSVGATARNDTIAGYSSRGPIVIDSSNRTKPNVSAPGSQVRSARPGGTYGNASGTSMAGPHVVGTVALIISANPALAGKVDIIEDIIEHTSVPKTTDQGCGDIPGSQVPNNTYGFGRIDALAAVNAAIALIPTSTYQEETNQNIKVYPNPVNDLLIFDLQNTVGSVNAEIFDIQGRMVWQEEWNTAGHSVFQVPFSEIIPGIYFYRLLTIGNIQVGKVVKN